MKAFISVFEDRWMIWLLQIFLLGISLFAVWKAISVYLNPGPYLMVERGDRSLTWLYTCYGASIAACLAAIQVFDGAGKYRVALIILDFICITYLFFLSDWFVNNVVYRLFQIVLRS